MRIYYAMLNNESVKEFQISENKSMETIYKNFSEYAIKKLKGHVNYVQDESKIGGFYLTNGIDKMEIIKR